MEEQQYKNRFTISITDVSILEKLENLSACMNMPKSKVINAILNNYLDDFIAKWVGQSQLNAGEKTQAGENNDDSFVKSILDQLNISRVDTLINQRMLSSIYQHIILFMSFLPNLELPEVPQQIKNRFDTNLPANFADMKEELLNRILMQDEDTGGDENE